MGMEDLSDEELFLRRDVMLEANSILLQHEYARDGNYFIARILPWHYLCSGTEPSNVHIIERCALAVTAQRGMRILAVKAKLASTTPPTQSPPRPKFPGPS